MNENGSLSKSLKFIMTQIVEWHEGVVHKLATLSVNFFRIHVDLKNVTLIRDLLQNTPKPIQSFNQEVS